jgi:hypothetical protein
MYNGELRHNSNSSGPKYGKVIKADDTVGIMFDSQEVYHYTIINLFSILLIFYFNLREPSPLQLIEKKWESLIKTYNLHKEYFILLLL